MHEISNSFYSGIVISGFGENDLFPSFIIYNIEGMCLNTLKYKVLGKDAISSTNQGIILPLAQREMVDTFIEGISPILDRSIKELLYETVDKYPDIIIEAILPKSNKKAKNELKSKLKKIGKQNLKSGLDKLELFQRKNFTNPVISVASFLPKDELASMAESLVNLTCLRKKITMDDETVGGPIDVAVISKGDGLIWIKRKHYFDKKYNQHFLDNYSKK